MYIVFSKTNTKMGRLIRYITKFNYNHVSLYLPDKKKMYSFCRNYYEMPFVGGFNRESALYLMYPKNHVEIRVIKIPLKDNQVYCLKQIILEFENKKGQYLYNLFFPFTLIFKKMKTDNVYTCVTFVLYILNLLNIEDDRLKLISNKVLITPKDLNKALCHYLYSDLILVRRSDLFYYSSTYFRRFNFLQKLKITLSYMLKLFKNYLDYKIKIKS